VQGAGCRVQGAGCRVQGAGCRVQGAECTELECHPGVDHLGWVLRFQGLDCRVCHARVLKVVGPSKGNGRHVHLRGTSSTIQIPQE